MAQECSEFQQEHEWSDACVLDLIHEIEQLRFLWDPRDKDKRNRNKKNAAFKGLAEKFGVTAEQVKKKFATLLQAYRNCRRKIKNSKLQGTGTSNVYKPVWFAFEALNKFMEDVYTPQEVTETMAHGEESDDSGETDADSVTETVQIKEQTEDVATDHRQNFKTKEFLSPKKLLKKRRATDDLDARVDEAYQLILEKRREVQERDECAIFGELVAAKLRKMDEVTRQYVMNDMNNLMFHATICRTYASSNFRRNTIPFPTHRRRNHGESDCEVE